MAAKNDRLIVAAGAARIELTTPAAVAEEFDDAHADPAGCIEYLAVVEFKVMSLPETASRSFGALVTTGASSTTCSVFSRWTTLLTIDPACSFPEPSAR